MARGSRPATPTTSASAAGSARFQRAIASPRVVRRPLRAMLEIDVRPILPLIQAPTLVLHRRDFQLIPVAHGRYLAEHIRGARLVELEGRAADVVGDAGARGGPVEGS